MKRKLYLTAGIICLTFSGLYAQINVDDFRKQAMQQFQDFRAQSEKTYRDFRDQANAEYAEFMSKAWQEFQSFRGEMPPKSPDPIVQPVAEPRTRQTADRLPSGTIDPLPVRNPQPQPIVPIQVPTTDVPDNPLPEPEKAVPAPEVLPVEPIKPEPTLTQTKQEKPTPRPTVATPEYSFTFYNTECKVSMNESLRFRLPDASEKSAAEAWKILSGKQYDTLLYDFLKLRDQLNLSDWGYYQLLKAFSEKFFGKDSNEAIFLQVFVLVQSGYKVRLARTNSNRFTLLIPFRETIYEYSYLSIDGAKYYIINKEMRNQALFLCKNEFPKEQYFQWQTGQPRFAEKLNEPKSFSSRRYPEMNVSVRTNQNLIDYYNNYPLSNDWNLYTLADLSENAKQAIYPVLRKVIAGKSKTEAVNMFLNFLQTCFGYKTDAEQFGYERPFFPDESFYFPFNNCKDRATLFAILVREFLDLEVVLLHYPGHLASAVHFTEDVEGDYLMVNGKKFIVCDPTYIGANLGRAMDQFKGVSARVVPIW